jgi:hypothetical protein
MPGIMLMSVVFYCYGKCRYATCHYAECRYAICHYAECRGVICGDMSVANELKLSSLLMTLNPNKLERFDTGK